MKIEPITKVEVKSKASGIVKKLYVDYGDRVKKGQMLAELDREIHDQVRGSPVWAEKENLLASVPGIGPVIARTLIADLPELGEHPLSVFSIGLGSRNSAPILRMAVVAIPS